METTWYVEERDSGLRVASGSAPDDDTAIQEATHYAMMYAQDGPILMRVNRGRKELVRMSLGGVTITEVPNVKVQG